MTADRQSTTETELAAVTIGPLQRLTGKVELAEPDPAWPQLFAREAEAQYADAKSQVVEAIIARAQAEAEANSR